MECETARLNFERAIDRDDPKIDLAEACFWVSAEANPELDVETYRGKLEALAARCPGGSSGSLGERVLRLNHHLFRRERYQGNREDYYDPRNSYLDCVLDRRTGIPITLSILWMAVGDRLGIPSHGIGFPGHFLVGVESEPRVFVDAFAGTVVDEAECRARLREMYRGAVDFDASLLDPTPRRDVLARVLRNLKQIHAQAKDFPQAIACIDRILMLAPDSALDLRDRGLLYRALECWNAARDDLERFVSLAPEAPEVSDVQLVLDELRARTAHIH